MTSARPQTVDYAQLLLGRRVGQGGQGSVHEVTNRTITIGSGPSWPVVFKEYDAASLQHLDSAALTAMVDLLLGLSATEGEWLCEHAAWPSAVVERQGAACGFLMRSVPDRFRFDLRSLSGTAPTTRRLANVEYLLNDDAYIAGIGLRISDSDRLSLLTDLSATLTRLHRLGIVVGDLSPKNLLFSTIPEAACFLLDCDAMRLHGTSVLPQAETPDWQLPAGEEKATGPGDIYKLGLLAVRLFERNQTSTDPTALNTVTPTLGNLAHSSLSAEPGRRPSPSLWTEMLSAAAPTVRITLQPQSAVPTPAPNVTGPQPTPIFKWPAPAGLSAAVMAIAAVVIVALVVALVSKGSNSARDTSLQAGTTTAEGSGNSPATTSTRTPANQIGVVTIAPSLIGDPRAIAVATTLNTYFSGINNHDYDSALSTLDPSGPFDTSNQQNRANFADAVSTTFDRNIELIDLTPTGSSTATGARVTFQSNQAAGMGPRGQEWETCTNWDLMDSLTPSGGTYLIYRTAAVGGPSAC
ncbi:hypothetical protein [Nocardia sp. NPDC006630]|uniref:hypothetical protein n=1 Tax=Nocardia sp. NPDC006630 TaxID=3157181 RepID=UPI0033B378FF